MRLTEVITIKKIFFILLSGFLLINLKSADCKELKIAVVDISDISANYIWFQEQYVKLSEKKETIHTMIATEEKEIKALEEVYGKTYDQKERLIKEAEIKKRRSELSSFIADSKQLITKKEEQLFMESKMRIMNALKEIAELDEIDLIFAKDQVLYFAESRLINLTDKTLRKLNGGKK